MSRLRPAWRQLRLLLGDRTGPMLVLMAVSVVAGVAEAGVLALVAVIAAALVGASNRLAVELGPLSLDTGIGVALCAACVLAVVRLGLQLGMAWLPAQISTDVQARMQGDMFDSFSRASWPTQAAELEGHLQELMTSHILRATEAVIYVSTGLSAFVMFVALVVTAFVLSVPVALAVLISAAGMLMLLRPLNKVGRAAALRLSQANIDYAAGLSEAARLAEEANVFGTTAEHRKRLGRLIDDARGSFFRFQFTARLAHSSYQSVIILLIVGGLAGLYAAGSRGLSTLGAAVLILVRAATYGQQVQGNYHGLHQALPYLARLESVESRYRASAPTDGGLELPEIRSLSMHSVDFAYRADRPVLRHLSFEVRVGESIGIVGPSGSGKSSLVQLLLRLREPTRGDFLLNGEPAKSFRRSDWQRRVAYVGQEPRIFQGTVADNIRYFRALDDATVERAARSAHIHDEVMAMAEGYETMIGQRADAVSGGQRQRICLARALAAEPDLLVLDEPTSALDLTSEAAIAASLAELHGRVTLFIVAHRLSTLSTCDRVLVLSDGVVEAIGTQAELTRSNAFFRRATEFTRRVS